MNLLPTCYFLQDAKVVDGKAYFIVNASFSFNGKSISTGGVGNTPETAFFEACANAKGMVIANLNFNEPKENATGKGCDPMTEKQKLELSRQFALLGASVQSYAIVRFNKVFDWLNKAEAATVFNDLERFSRLP